jgi:hypothetical protein
MRFKLQAASNKRQACDNMSCFFMHRNNYTGHTTKGEIYGRTNKTEVDLVGTEEWHHQPREGNDPVCKRLYLEWMYTEAQGPTKARRFQDLRWNKDFWSLVYTQIQSVTKD